MAMILPGSCIGILGGGQLGRMLAQSAQTLGYRVHVYEPQANCPAGAVANREVNAPYTDIEALREFAKNCDVVTYEFENIPAGPLRQIEADNITQLYPHWRVLEVCQNRLREKTWLRTNGIPHARFCEVAAEGDVAAAIKEIGIPCVVKTADFGYDGKGQLKVKDEADVKEAVKQFAGQRAVVERFINFQCELSVVVARSSNGECRTFPVSENIHTNHILDFSIVPARVAAGICEQAEAIGREIAQKLDVVGLIGVELFLTTEGELLVNELAPRPHNSGHYTLDACPVSQFEQHVRAVCGLPLGNPAQRSPAVMVNILGDVWFEPDAKTRRLPKWETLLAHAGCKLHLYGKSEPRVGRKMGHFTMVGDEMELTLVQARELKSLL